MSALLAILALFFASPAPVPWHGPSPAGQPTHGPSSGQPTHGPHGQYWRPL